jgi:hypothetical protein
MKSTLLYLWSRKTTAFGYVQVGLGVIAATNGLFSIETTKWLILINGLVTAAIGHFNNSQLKTQAKADQVNADNLPGAPDATSSSAIPPADSVPPL